MRVSAIAIMLLALPAIGQAAPKHRSAEDAPFQQWLAGYLQRAYRDDPDFRDLVYGYALVDLNGDGLREAVVWARDANCGTGGCRLDVFTHSRSAWRLSSSANLTRPPIKLLSRQHHGWRDLAALAAGGGIRRPYEQRLRFNGYKYEPVEPADWAGVKPRPPRLHGRTLITDATIPLFPGQCRRTEEAPSIFGPMPITSDKPGSC